MDHPFQESKKIEKIAQSYQLFIESLPQRVDPDPFLNLFSPQQEPYPNQRLYEELQSQGSQPLSSELESWIYFLLESRLMLVAEVRDAALVYKTAYPVPALGDLPQTLFQLQSACMKGSLPQREQMLKGVLQVGHELAEFRQLKAARQREFFERLSIPSDEKYASPVPLGKAQELARQVLEKTQGLAGDWVKPGYLAFHEARQGFAGQGRQGAEEGWPARLAKDVLLDLLGKPKELREVRLSALRLPKRQSPFSFLEGFYGLGRALRRELCSPRAPFIQRFEPYENQQERWGYFLSLSTSSEVFARRRLGLSRSASKDFHGVLFCSWLLELRRLAADVLLKAAAQKSESEFFELAQHLSAEIYQVEYPVQFALSHRSIPRRVEAQFIQLLSTPVMLQESVDKFDEDYLEHPRAWEELRDMLMSPALLEEPKAKLEAQAALAQRGLNIWLDLLGQAREV